MAGYVEKLRKQRKLEKLAKEMSYQPFSSPIPQGVVDYAREVGGRIANPANTLRSLIDRMKSQPVDEMAMDWANPVAGGLGGMIKSKFGRIPESTADVDKLADLMLNKGRALGHYVQSGSSNISNSRYVTFKNPEGIDYQVRLSGHGDRHSFPEGERFSVDPSSMNTYEMAKDWLKEKGINLDKRLPKQHPSQTNYLAGTKVSELNALRQSRGGAPVTPEEVIQLGLIDDVGLTVRMK